MNGSVIGLGGVLAALDGMGAAATAPVAAGVNEAAQWGQGAVAAVAPYKTGDYARSIKASKPTITPTSVEATVGTNRPQGRRLEFGFVGEDALGRYYNQAPRPHWEPVRQQMPAVLRAAVLSKLGGL